MNEKEIVNVCAEALKTILATAQQALFYLDDKNLEIDTLRDKFKILTFPGNQTQHIEEKSKENGIIKFNEEEILKMPKPFRSLFRACKVNAHVRKRPDGYYEVRCQIDNQSITASSKVLYEAKAKFIVKLAELRAPTQRAPQTSKVIFKNYYNRWLETVKKPYVKEDTYKRLYVQASNAYILPKFGDRDIRTIKSLELQEFINVFTESERFRTAQKVHQILSSFFEYAVNDEIINRSPMAKIKVAYYEQKHGVPVTRDEEAAFIRELKNSPTVYAQAYAFIIYTGLRRSELASAVVDDKWVTVTTAKQRKGKSEKMRRIPISPMLKNVMPLIDVAQIVNVSPGVLTKHVKDFFPNHHLHDLRHTFITRCQECGIQREIVSLWAGHAADSSITSTVYTHLEQYSDNQIAEMQKFSYVL